MKSPLAVSILLLMLSVSIPAVANDSAVYGVSGAIAPMENHPSIRMVCEKVDVKLGWEKAKVRCEFVFKNEGPATTVKIGFPEQAWGDITGHSYSDLLGFRSWVDGKPIETKHIKAAEQRDYSLYSTWHVKDVPFAAGQTRVIVDEYRSRYGGMSDGSCFFSYILRTGANWKDTIGDAMITVDASEIAGSWKAGASGYTKYLTSKGDVFTWHMRDFEPDEDVMVHLEYRHKLFINNTPYFPRGVQKVPVDKVLMAPASAFSNIGYSHYIPVYVEWDGKVKATTIKAGEHSIVLKAGSRTAIVDGSQRLVLPRAPENRDGRLYVPAVSVAKALGFMVTYDSKTGSTYIEFPKKEKAKH